MLPSHRFISALHAAVFGAAVACTCAPVHATDLLAAWQSARGHDATFAASQAGLRAAREKIPQGDAVLAPRIDLNADGGHANETYTPGIPSESHPRETNRGQTYDVGLKLTKPLYDAVGSVTRDRLHKEAAQAEVEFMQAGQDLMLRVARAYFEVLLARESLNLAGAQKQAITEQLGLAKQSYELGIAPITDVNDAQSRYDTVDAAQIAGATDLEVKSNTFRQLTGLDPLSLAPISPTLDARPPEAGSLDRWLADTQVGNTNLRSLALGVEIAHRTIDQYKLHNSPVLSLVAGYGRLYENGSISTSGGNDRTNNGTIGVQLTIPLFDGGNRRSQMRQAVATEDQQRDTLEAARRDAENATRQFFASVRDGAARIKALERARDSGASSLDSSKVGREVGVRNAIDVLNAQQSYFQTLYNLSAARYDYLYNQLQLAASAGALDQPALGAVNAGLQIDGKTTP
jgi:outer membrane protein